VAVILELLQKFRVFEFVVAKVMEEKTEYVTRDKGEKVLLKQVKDIYEMIENGDKRFSAWKINKDTGLIEEKTKEDLEAEKLVLA
jgi:hypothetical protein